MMGSCPGTRFLMFSQRSSQSKWPVRVVRGYEVLDDMGCVTVLYLKQTSLTKPVRKMSTMYRYDGLYQVDKVSTSHGFFSGGARYYDTFRRLNWRKGRVDMMCADFISVYVPETCGISICI